MTEYLSRDRSDVDVKTMTLAEQYMDQEWKTGS